MGGGFDSGDQLLLSISLQTQRETRRFKSSPHHSQSVKTSSLGESMGWFLGTHALLMSWGWWGVTDPPVKTKIRDSPGPDLSWVSAVLSASRKEQYGDGRSGHQVFLLLPRPMFQGEQRMQEALLLIWEKSKRGVCVHKAVAQHRGRCSCT